MSVHSVMFCDNSAVFTGSRLPSLHISTTEHGGFDVNMPPAMPAPVANELAALFAAAPDMLAALQAGRAALAAWMEIADDEDDRESDHEALAAMDAAIAKAEGKL